MPLTCATCQREARAAAGDPVVATAAARTALAPDQEKGDATSAAKVRRLLDRLAEQPSAAEA